MLYSSLSELNRFLALLMGHMHQHGVPHLAMRQA